MGFLVMRFVADWVVVYMSGFEIIGFLGFGDWRLWISRTSSIEFGGYSLLGYSVEG